MDLLTWRAKLELNSSTDNFRPLVSVKNKFQVVIPRRSREDRHSGGRSSRSEVERGKITFTPKSVMDRAIAEAEDFKEGVLMALSDA
jgi:hypothetical protein